MNKTEYVGENKEVSEAEGLKLVGVSLAKVTTWYRYWYKPITGRIPGGKPHYSGYRQ